MCKVQVGLLLGVLRTVAFPVTWWWNRRQGRTEGDKRKGQGKKKEGGERRKKARVWGVGDRLGKREQSREQGRGEQRKNSGWWEVVNHLPSVPRPWGLLPYLPLRASLTPHPPP